MTSDLFGDEPQPLPAARTAPSATGEVRVRKARRSGAVRAALPSQSHCELAEGLPKGLHLGTSSWSFPGWGSLMWEGDYSESQLSREGLGAYAAHPLMRTVSVDRSFYRPMTESEFARLASQVPDHFRFVVKAPSLVTDAVVRDEDGRAREANPAFLDPELSLTSFVQPALGGLGAKLGALVFQLSPLSPRWLREPATFFQALGRMLTAASGAREAAHAGSDAVIAVELRDPVLLGPELAQCLRLAGATYCIGVHPRMPPVTEQLPMLRALWPGPALCRWNLNARHGAGGYERAKAAYGPFDTLMDPDPDNRSALTRLAAGTLAAGWPVYITINNKAEGSAPRSVEALAQAIHAALARPVAPK